jgi:hypothetical protein
MSLFHHVHSIASVCQRNYLVALSLTTSEQPGVFCISWVILYLKPRGESEVETQSREAPLYPTDFR